MGLFLFPNVSQSPDAALLSEKQREQTASEVNAAMLRSEGYSPGKFTAS